MSHISSPASILWSRLHLLSLVPHFLYLGSYISCLCLTSPVSVSHLLSPYHIFCLLSHISCILSHISCLCLTSPVSVSHHLSLISHILSFSHISYLLLTHSLFLTTFPCPKIGRNYFSACRWTDIPYFWIIAVHVFFHNTCVYWHSAPLNCSNHWNGTLLLRTVPPNEVT